MQPFGADRRACAHMSVGSRSELRGTREKAPSFRSSVRYSRGHPPMRPLVRHALWLAPHTGRRPPRPLPNSYQRLRASVQGVNNVVLAIAPRAVDALAPGATQPGELAEIISGEGENDGMHGA